VKIQLTFHYKQGKKGGFQMYRRNDIKLAERILQLDKLRDELYEELMKAMGSQANELLRRLQNY
jgi:hypothetical protein